MSDQKYNPNRRLVLDGQIVTQSEFITLMQKKVIGLDEPTIRLGLRLAQLGEVDWPEDASEKLKRSAQAVEKMAREGYGKMRELSEARQQSTVEMQAQREAEKQKWIEGYQATETPQALIQPLTALVEKSVAMALSDYFILKGEDIYLKKGIDPYKAFLPGFKNLADLFDKSSEMSYGFAKYEARLAFAAKRELGNDWPVALAGASKKDTDRIRKNMAAMSRWEDCGFKVADVPIGTLRVLTEVAYDKDPGTNRAMMKKTINKFLEESEKKGSYLNQLDARTLVNKANPEREARQKWDTFYFKMTADGPKLYGSMGLNDQQFTTADLVVDVNGRNTISWDGEQYVYSHVPTYAGQASEKALQEQSKIVIPFKKEEPKPDPKPVDVSSSLDDLFMDDPL